VLRVTIVTPSLNQGAFIERTVRSVLAQRGPFELEYLVVDGGSTDGTLEVLRRHEARIRWSSEPDRGQSHAINKGFRAATGQVLAWLNSDDTYEPGAVAAAVEALAGGARWCFGQCRIVDERDREIRRGISAWKNRLSRRYAWPRLLAQNFIAQPAVFFRRDLLEEAGPLDEALHYAMDYDLWLRFAARAEPVFLARDLACFRWHGRSKTGAGYGASAREAFAVARRRAAGRHPVAIARHLLHAAGMAAAYRLLDLLPARR
jgi:glycosyltransferase involved in cell wall biosynthesis